MIDQVDLIDNNAPEVKRKLAPEHQDWTRRLLRYKPRKPTWASIVYHMNKPGLRR
jgi:hypothetical protein